MYYINDFLILNYVWIIKLVIIIFADSVLDGAPASLSPAGFNANLASLLSANDKTRHPAQAQVLNHTAAALMGPTQLPPSNSAPEVETNVDTVLMHSKPATVRSTPVKPDSAPDKPAFTTAQTMPAALLGDQGEGEQEVTQNCPIPGCVWTSYKTHDPSMLEACVKMLSIHMKYEHDVSNTNSTGLTNSTRGDRAHREYMAATRPRTITKTVDDATSNLTEGRFLPMPLDMKALGRAMPSAIKPENTILDMSHVGVDVTNADTLRKCHDRALLSKKLRDFSDHNLRASHSAGDALVAVHTSKDSLKLGKEVKHLADTEECVRAFYNFLALSHNFHVLDYSPMALLKLVLEKQFTGPPAVEQYQKMFEKYIHDSAIKAQKKNPPPTYQDLLMIWNVYIVPNSMSSISMEAFVDKRVEKKLSQQVSGGKGGRGGGGGSGGGGGDGGRGGPLSKRPKLDYCQSWNEKSTYPLCSNKAADRGCIDSSGKALRHACNWKNKLTKNWCSSSNHGFHFH